MKITKKLALLVFTATILRTANAQEVQFGIKAGANIASFSGSDASGFSSQV